MKTPDYINEVEKKLFSRFTDKQRQLYEQIETFLSQQQIETDKQLIEFILNITNKKLAL